MTELPFEEWVHCVKCGLRILKTFSDAHNGLCCACNHEKELAEKKAKDHAI